MDILSPSNVVFILGVAGTVFGVYKHFKDPQVASEKTDALMGQQLKYIVDANEVRFKTMQESFNQLLLQSNNHIHTVDTKVDKLHESIVQMGKEVVKLGTIIEERIRK